MWVGEKMTTGCRDHKKRFAHIYIYIYIYIFYIYIYIYIYLFYVKRKACRM